MKVALLFDGASAYATNPDELILDTVRAIEQSLVSEGSPLDDPNGFAKRLTSLLTHAVGA